MCSNSNPEPDVRRVLLECTETYFLDVNTGIQRVVRNVTSHSAEVAATLGIACQPIVRVGDRFYGVPWRARSEASSSLLARTRGALKGMPNPLAPLARLPGVNWLDLRLRKLLFPRSLLRKVRRLRALYEGTEVMPGRGDTIVLLDNWWNPDVWPLVARAKSNGARIVVVVYDLLPVTNPEFFRPRLTHRFAACLDLVLEQGDRFLAISQHVCHTLRDFATGHRKTPPAPAAFQSFRLGSQLDRVAGGGKIRRALTQAFDARFGCADLPDRGHARAAQEPRHVVGCL